MALAPLTLGGNKALAKLTIIPFSSRKRFIPAGLPFVAMYNPTTFSTTHGQVILVKPKTDKQKAVVEFRNAVNKEIKVDLLLDATGASPGGGKVGSVLSKTAKELGGVDVLIAAFFLTTQAPNPITHEPNISRLIWGAGLFFDGVLKTATVAYNLFGPDGRPLRATISATFKEAPSATDIAKIKNFFSSPDVTKTYTVKAGDTLYNLAKNEYGEESFYLQLAEANDLKNYRKLVPGQTLIFPPINQDEVVEDE